MGSRSLNLFFWGLVGLPRLSGFLNGGPTSFNFWASIRFQFGHDYLGAWLSVMFLSLEGRSKA